jgi:putative endopeptidase
LAQASKLAPQIDWSALFAAVGSPVDRFVVSQPSFISALGRMTETVPVGDWRIYFRYKLLDDYAPFLPAAFDQLYFDFHQRALLGVQLQRPRWQRGLAALNGNIGEIVGRLYVARSFPPRSRRRIRLLVDNLLQAYARSLEQLDWMGPQTRAQAQLKLSKLTAKIGYPDKWRNYSALRVSADDLIGNLVRSSQFELHRQAARLGTPVDREEWQLTPQTVNAYYDPTLNEIVFPAAILQPPFFDARADDAANYGAIGAVIGHEISHGFDDQGRQFDGDGNLRDWWTSADAERFKARTAALVAQYSTYTVLDGMHVNGQLTLGENIADLSGLTVAYKAYQISLHAHEAPIIDGLTGPQRFFLGWAQIWRRKDRDDNLRRRISVDPHSPEEFRANGAASNVDAFYDAFGVEPGDRMYRPPAERVKLW